MKLFEVTRDVGSDDYDQYTGFVVVAADKEDCMRVIVHSLLSERAEDHEIWGYNEEAINAFAKLQRGDPNSYEEALEFLKRFDEFTSDMNWEVEEVEMTRGIVMGSYSHG